MMNNWALRRHICSHNQQQAFGLQVMPEGVALSVTKKPIFCLKYGCRKLRRFDPILPFLVEMAKNYNESSKRYAYFKFGNAKFVWKRTWSLRFPEGTPNIGCFGPASVIPS